MAFVVAVHLLPLVLCLLPTKITVIGGSGSGGTAGCDCAVGFTKREAQNERATKGSFRFHLPRKVVAF